MSDVEMGNASTSGTRDRLRNRLLLTKTFLDFIYDPDQDPEEKRAVRKNYRSLAKTVEGVLCLS